MVEPVNDIRNWRITDPEPKTNLVDILPYSKRALALVYRNASKTILHTDYLQIAGAVSILKGLEYHHGRFLAVIGQLAKGISSDEEQLRHEAAAYVNRAGQFYYFCQSSLVKKICGHLSIPRLTDLMMFRNKHAAHRSVDNPRPEDNEQLQTVHAMSLSEFSGWLWLPKSESLKDGFPPFWGCAYVAFQIHTADKVVELVIERDHGDLMFEAYGVLERVLS
jgi:hypothetical protein